MEHNRNLRSLIPPLVFVASLVWVQLLQSGWAGFQSMQVGPAVVALLAGGAAVILALGFVLSSLSMFLLRMWSCRAFGKTIDIAGFSDDEIVRFGAKVGLSKDSSLKHQLQSAALYDHHFVQSKLKGVHEWAARRWNVFHVSVHSCLALILAHAAWLTYHLAQGSQLIWSWAVALGWWLPDAALLVCMGLNARVAFRENRDVFRVLLEVPDKAMGVKPIAPTAAEQGAAVDVTSAS